MEYVRTGLARETAFFQKHPKYRNMLAKCGTTNLARTLNQILMLHIRDCLPDIKSRIMGMMVTVQHNIEALGEPTDAAAGPGAKGATLLQILSKFARGFANSIEGRGSGDGASSVEMEVVWRGAYKLYFQRGLWQESTSQCIRRLDDVDIRLLLMRMDPAHLSLCLR